jgi:F-type H+-transporting ATPase subunit gamma
MPSLIDIRRRIRTVRNTQQITKAMKMVSAARLRRAQDRVLMARPYADILHELVANAAAAAAGDETLAAHPLLVKRPEERIQLLLLTSDRGLAGSFNSNLIKAAQQFLAEHAQASTEMELLGRKGRDFFRKRGASITSEHLGLADKALYEDVVPIAEEVIQRYRNKEVDSVYLLYNEFKSVLSQELTVFRVLPIELPEEARHVEYIYEQPPRELLDVLLPRYVEVAVHHAVLESAAAEHAARMTAMDAATTNAAELIDNLTLYMNRVRQASITSEIIEVVSGASALE